MNINQAVTYILAKARKNQVGHIPPEHLNIYFQRAQYAVINELWGNKQDYQAGRPVPPISYEQTSTISDELAPLVEQEQYRNPGEAINKPSDYLYFINTEAYIYYNDGTEAWVPVILTTQAEKNKKLNSTIIYPRHTAPICVNTGDRLEIYPSDLLTVRLTYLRKPEPPVWAYTVSNNRPVYDPVNSQGFELPETVHNEIVERVLSYIGISTRDNNLYQASENSQQKGV